MEFLRKLWYDIREQAKVIRLHEMDGLMEWQKMKPSLLLHKGIIDVRKFKHIFDLIVYYVDPDDTNHENVKMIVDDVELDNTIETHHFFIKLFRITLLCDYNLPIVKFAQIAYNLGQFEAMCDIGAYDEKLLSFFDRHNLSVMNSYC